MPLRPHRPPKRLPIPDYVARERVGECARDGRPQPGAVGIDERARRGGRGESHQSRSVAPSRMRGDILEECDGRVERQRREADKETAVQVRPKRHQRKRQPKPGVAPVGVAREQCEERAEQHEAEHLRPQLRLQHKSARRREQDRKLDRGRRAGGRLAVGDQGHRRRRAHELPELQPDHTGRIVNQSHGDFRQPLVIAPSIAPRGVGIRIVMEQMACGDEGLAEAQMAPQIGVGEAIGVREQDCDQDGRGSIAQERNGGSELRGTRCIGGRRYSGRDLVQCHLG